MGSSMCGQSGGVQWGGGGTWGRAVITVMMMMLSFTEPGDSWSIEGPYDHY